jgi:hypothetical protein
MRRAVYKFALAIEVETQVCLDVGAHVVHVGMQNGELMLWAELDTHALTKPPRVYRVFGTGHEIPDMWMHVGTVFDGPFVWHVYEKS